jgi:hypothetical protein
MKIYLFFTVFYFAVAPWLIGKFGISGASAAYLLFNLGVTALIMWKSAAILSGGPFALEGVRKYESPESMV